MIFKALEVLLQLMDDTISVRNIYYSIYIYYRNSILEKMMKNRVLTGRTLGAGCKGLYRGLKNMKFKIKFGLLKLAKLRIVHVK